MTENQSDENKPALRRVGPKLKAAILACHDASRFEPMKNGRLRMIATRFEVKYFSLKEAWSAFSRGLIDLGDAVTVQHHEINAKVQWQRTVENIVSLEKFLNDTLEVLMRECRVQMADGNRRAFFDLGIDKIVQNLKAVAGLREIKERGYLAELEKLRQEAEKVLGETLSEKAASAVVINPTPTPPAPARVKRAMEIKSVDAIFTDIKTHDLPGKDAGRAPEEDGSGNRDAAGAGAAGGGEDGAHTGAAPNAGSSAPVA